MRESDGTAVEAIGGTIELSASQSPGVTLYSAEQGIWVAETPAGTTRVQDRGVVEVDGQRWCVHLPQRLPPTAKASGDWLLDAINVEIRVSGNEEDIELRLHHGPQVVNLPHRNHHALLLALARERIADSKRGIENSAHGWMDRGILLQALGVSVTTLHQYVHRTRKEFEAAQIVDGEQIVQRRRGSGELRIGSSNLVISAL